MDLSWPIADPGIGEPEPSGALSRTNQQQPCAGVGPAHESLKRRVRLELGSHSFTFRCGVRMSRRNAGDPVRNSRDVPRRCWIAPRLAIVSTNYLQPRCRLSGQVSTRAVRGPARRFAGTSTWIFEAAFHASASAQVSESRQHFDPRCRTLPRALRWLLGAILFSRRLERLGGLGMPAPMDIGLDPESKEHSHDNRAEDQRSMHRLGQSQVIQIFGHYRGSSIRVHNHSCTRSDDCANPIWLTVYELGGPIRACLIQSIPLCYARAEHWALRPVNAPGSIGIRRC